MNLQLHEPSCETVYVHLPGQVSCVINSNDDCEVVEGKLSKAETPLLRYFWRHPSLKRSNGYHLKFAEYYGKYTLSKLKAKKQTLRRASGSDSDSDIEIDASVASYEDRPPHGLDKKVAMPRKRLHFARIEDSPIFRTELHCLTAILRHVDRDSFEDCYTVNGKRHSTFADAAYALGIFSDQDEFELAFKEMIFPNLEVWKKLKPGHVIQCGIHNPFMLRRTFVAMCLHGASGPTLFDKFWHYMSDDLPRGSDNIAPITEATKKNLLLAELQSLLFDERSSLSEVGLPEINRNDIRTSEILNKERSRCNNDSLLRDFFNLPKLNKDQRAVYDHILHLVALGNRAPPNRIVYVNAEAGTGKTFMAAVIAAYLRLDGHIVAAAATSGLAALNLMCGTTLHKCFDLPVVVEGERVISRLSPMSHQGIVLFHSKLILLDEAPTTSETNFDAIDSMLQELMGNNLPFGGKVVLAIGDFNQMPPVVPRAEPSGVVAQTILAHHLWPGIHKMSLGTNYRQKNDPHFSEDLRFMTTGPRSIRHSTNDSENFISHPMPDDVTVCTTFRKAMKAYQLMAFLPHWTH